MTTSQSPAAGRRSGRDFSPHWAVEFETWVRAANPECCSPRQRETLFSLSALKAGWRMAGCSRTCLGVVTLLNGGVERAAGPGRRGQAKFQLPRRMALAVDVRGNGGDSTFIVRPTAGLVYYFR